MRSSPADVVVSAGDDARLLVMKPEVISGAVVEGASDVSVSRVGSEVDVLVVRREKDEVVVVTSSSKSVRVVVKGGNETTPGPDGGRTRVAVKIEFVAGMAPGLLLHMPNALTKTSSVKSQYGSALSVASDADSPLASSSEQN
jgi:hypothetical protein